MIHRKGRCWLPRLCMSCGYPMWLNRATFTECGPNTENAYHPAKCSFNRPEHMKKGERAWHEEVKNRGGREE
jgi:hypothetical protein